MKMIFVLPYVPSLIRVRPYHLIRELAGRHEISVLAAGSPNDIAAADELRAFCRQVEVAPLRLSSMLRGCIEGMIRGAPLQASVCRSSELRARMRRLLADERFDLVHIEHLRAMYLRELIPPELPVVLDAVDCISLLLERTLRSSHSLRQRLIAALELPSTRAYEARVVPRFDQVAVTSAIDGQALQRLAPGAAIRTIPNGVDLDYFRPLGTPREPATLVFSGKMSYHANATAVVFFVERILPLIRASRPDVRLCIAGSNPPPSIQALARDPSVTVTGYLPDLRQALGRSTIAVCPMTVKVGIQNKVLEAMAMGLPVVSTPLGIAGLDVVPEKDVLVANTPELFAQQVLRLLGAPDLQQQLGAAGHAYVELHHRWDVAARQFEALYAEVIASKQAASGTAHSYS